MQNHFKITLCLSLLLSAVFSGMIGCSSIRGKIVIEKVEPKADVEFRRKVDEWTEQLHSDDSTIRSSAAVSLLGLNLLEAQEPLIAILKNDREREDVRISVIKAFGFARDDRATNVLIDLLDNDAVPIQNASAGALGMLRTRTALKKMSESVLEPKRSLNSKMLLAKAMGNTNDRDVVDPLIKVLAIDDRGVREVAMKSLEKITKQKNDNDSAWWKEWWIRNKAKTREQWLEDIVLKEEENTKQLEVKNDQLKLEVAQKSIKFLEIWTDKTDPKPFIEAMKSEYPDVRIFAAKELAKMKDPAIVDVLINAISDEREEVRIEVVQTLGEIGDERAVKPLIGTLDDESPVVREKAARALGKLGKSEAEESLISSLQNNTNLSIVCAIIESLGQIGDPRAVESLVGLLTHKESQIRECTAAALGKIRDNRSVVPLIAALNDEQERVRWYAADSLGKIGDLSSVDSLIKLLSDTSARVRESAVTALRQMGNQKSVESLIKALQDVDKRVADQAAESLVNIKLADFDIMDIIANTFYTSKDYKRAEIVFEKQLSEYSKQPELQEKIAQTRIKLAKTLFTLKDWQKAIVLYEELVKRFSSDNTIKTELILCLKEMKQYDHALEWCTNWMRETPQNSQICWQSRLDIANAMFEQGKCENVKGLLDGFRTEDPNFGGEEFKQGFQKLHEQCLAELANPKTLSQNAELEHSVNSDDKK